MTAAQPSPASTQDVEVLLSELDRTWRRDGVRPVDRREMIGDVAPDLEAASRDGIDPRTLLTPDPASFARQVAEARGVDRLRSDYPRMLFGAAVGAAAAFVLGWRLALIMVTDLTERVELERRYEVLGAVVAYSGLAAFCLAGVIAGIWLALRGRTAVRATLRRVALLLPLAAMVVTPVTIAFARSTGYSTVGSVVLIEAGIVLGGCALALVVARRSALRHSLD